MNQSWAAELKIAPTIATYLIESQFPELKPVNLELIGEGWDNIVYRVNSIYVFRFPRRQLGVNLLEAEGELLPQLHHRFPISIPRPLFYGHPVSEYNWPFLGYQFLEGQSACKMHLSYQERVNLAAPLAHFLKSLHSISECESLALGAKYDHLGRLDVSARWPQIRKNLEKIQEQKLFDHCKTLLIKLDTMKQLHDAGPKVLVHGDLYARHLLINETRKLAGVIDWGDMHVGNPAVDLQIVFSFLPENAYAVFFSIYGAIDEKMRQLAIFRALYHTSILVLYSHEIADKDLLAESIMGLQLIANL